jgi:hypothetical protein
MLRVLLAMCLFAIFLCAWQLILMGVVWALICVGASWIALAVYVLGYILLLPASFVIAGRVVLRLFGPIPTCEPYPSSPAASE